MTLSIPPSKKRPNCLKLSPEHPSSRPITRVSSPRVPRANQPIFALRRANFKRWMRAGISRIFAQPRLAPTSITRPPSLLPPPHPTPPNQPLLKFANHNDNPNPRHSKARAQPTTATARKKEKEKKRSQEGEGEESHFSSSSKRETLALFGSFSTELRLFLFSSPVAL